MATLGRLLQVRVAVDPGPKVSGLVAVEMYRRRLRELMELEHGPADEAKFRAASRLVWNAGTDYEPLYVVALAERVCEANLDALKARLNDAIRAGLMRSPVHGVEVYVDASGLGQFAATELYKVAIAYGGRCYRFEITGQGTAASSGSHKRVSRVELLFKLATRLERSQVAIPEEPQMQGLLEELSGMELLMRSSGRWAVEPPAAGRDDLAVALAMAVWRDPVPGELEIVRRPRVIEGL